jgi:hypothetical protein
MAGRAELQALAARARQMYARGMSKQNVFSALAVDLDKPVQAARLVASLPNREGVRRYRISNRVLAICIFIVATFAGFAKFSVGSAVNLTAGLLAGAVFFGIFAWCAWGIWKVAFPAYTSTIILLFLGMSQAPRAILADLGGPDFNPDGTSALYFVLDLVFGLLMPIFLLWFTARTRNNLFSKTKFFGGPRKDKSGNYVFESAWETRNAAPEIMAPGDAA